MTPQDRLAAALAQAMTEAGEPARLGIHAEAEAYIAVTDAWATIAADMELGRRIRDANDPLLSEALNDAAGKVSWLRAALTEDAA